MSARSPVRYWSLHMLPSFFSMIRPPPRSTLFPSRRSSDLVAGEVDEVDGVGPADREPAHELVVLGLVQDQFVRSEEHTSELQSRPHLVCRLLLEKKKAGYFILAPEEATFY